MQQLGLWEEKEADHLRHISSTFVISCAHAGLLGLWSMPFVLKFYSVSIGMDVQRCVMETIEQTFRCKRACSADMHSTCSLGQAIWPQSLPAQDCA